MGTCLDHSSSPLLPVAGGRCRVPAPVRHSDTDESLLRELYRLLLRLNGKHANDKPKFQALKVWYTKVPTRKGMERSGAR